MTTANLYQLQSGPQFSMTRTDGDTLSVRRELDVHCREETTRITLRMYEGETPFGLSAASAVCCDDSPDADDAREYEIAIIEHDRVHADCYTVACRLTAVDVAVVVGRFARNNRRSLRGFET